MTSLAHKNMDSSDETREFPHGRSRIATLGGATIARLELDPGWRWSNDVKAIAGTESCQVNHLGYLISGRLHVRMADGTEAEVSAGDVYTIPPGHDAWVVGNETAIGLELMGGAEYAKPA